MKYLYQIGETQTYIYNTKQLGALFEVYFDELALLSYFMQRENVDTVYVVERTPKIK